MSIALISLQESEISSPDVCPVAITSRTTNKAEEGYPQIDIEAMGIDFALRRFRNYLVLSPDQIEVVIDHKTSLMAIGKVRCVQKESN